MLQSSEVIHTHSHFACKPFCRKGSQCLFIPSHRTLSVSRSADCRSLCMFAPSHALCHFCGLAMYGCKWMLPCGSSAGLSNRSVEGVTSLSCWLLHWLCHSVSLWCHWHMNSFGRVVFCNSKTSERLRGSECICWCQMEA